MHRRVPPENINRVARENLSRLRDGDVFEIRVVVAFVRVILALAFLETALRAAGIVPVLRLRIIKANL